MAQFNFSTAEYDDFEGGGYEVIPEGEYELMCEEAEEVTTKSGGTMIKAKFRVLGPTHAERVVFNNFNVVNKSDKAQEIARRQLATWARAVGRPNATDTDELLNRPFIGVVDVEAGDDKYGPQNRIQGYLPKEGSAPKSSSGAPSAPAQPPAAPRTPPAAASPAAAAPSKGKPAPWDV